jgi:hypothetical protein
LEYVNGKSATDWSARVDSLKDVTEAELSCRKFRMAGETNCATGPNMLDLISIKSQKERMAVDESNNETCISQSDQK